MTVPAYGDMGQARMMQNMQRMLADCEKSIERVRRETTYNVRQESKHRAQAMHSEIQNLRHTLGRVKQGLIVVRRSLEQIPHHTMQGSASVHRRVMRIFNDLAENYNVLQREVQEF